MTCTIVAQVVDALGTAAWYWRGDLGGRHLHEIRSHPAASFDTSQPATIPVTLTHDGQTLGAVVYLEHNVDNTDLTAVAVLDADPEQVHGLYPSGEITAQMPYGTTIATRSTLTALAIVGQTAGVGARRVRAYDGDFRSPYSRGSWGRNDARILERAVAACPYEQRSARATELRIHRPAVVEQHGYDDMAYVRPEPKYAYPGMGPVEWSRPHNGVIRVY